MRPKGDNTAPRHNGNTTMKTRLLRYTLFLLAALTMASSLSARQTFSLNRDWKFFTYSENNSTIVNLPHQWNSDALGGKLDYYRSTGNYLRYIDFKPEWRGKRIFLRFGGANLIADVLVNGRHAGRHEGGSGAFIFEISDLLNFNGRDLVWVIVSNANQTTVLPSAGNEISYGGLFREVSIIIEDDTHIALDHFASEGIYIHTRKVTNDIVEGEVEVRVTSNVAQSATLSLVIKAPEGKEQTTSQRIRTQNGTISAFIPFQIKSPQLWNGVEAPNLYDFQVRLNDGDPLTVQTGFRYYEVGKEGFMLNGRPYPIRGVVMHRDRALTGTAISESEVLEDIRFAVEMGANAIRVVGGSHHPAFYRICDNIGLMVINDLPLMGATTLNGKGFFNTESFRENGKQQLQEMIFQQYNHPSVVIWNLFSELEARGDSPVEYLRELHSLCKRLDPNRFTSGWSNQDGEINFVTDLVVWSHNLGWMEGNPEDIQVWQEQLHTVPEWSSMHSAVSYKCGGNIFHQSDVLQKPLATSSWHPERWQTHFHETYLEALSDDNHFWGLFVDGLFDYASVDAHRSAGGVCDMGVVSFNRQVRKDAFYLYKANWGNDDFIYIAERRWTSRISKTQTIKVYTNMPEVELTVNSEFLGTKESVNGIATWENVALKSGPNSIEASSGGFTDRIAIEILQKYNDEL